MNWLIQKLGLIPVNSAGAWGRKWTTWLSALQMAFLALVALYITFPQRWQDLTPDWAITTVIIGAVVTTFLIVFAANVLQTKLVVPVKYDPPTRLSGTDSGG